MSRGVITHLAGKNQHGNRIQPAAYHAGDGIGSAGAGGYTDSRNLIMNTGIALRCNGAGLLMMVEITVKPWLMPKTIIQVHRSSAGNHKHIGDPLLHQFFGNIVRNLHSH